ncbi:MAG: FlgB family protein [Sulfitobacter sp.]
MFEKLDIFQMSAAMARHAGQRQAVTAQNVANADTPGYVARDLPEFASFYSASDTASLQRASRSKHLNGMMPGQDAPITRTPGEGSPNGNQVSLETELLKSVDAKRQHDRALAIYKSSLSVLRSAIRS